MRRWTALVAVLSVVVVLAIAYFVTRSPDQESKPSRGSAAATPSPSTSPTASPSPSVPTAPASASCPTKVARPFAPVDIKVAGLPGRVSVIRPPRDLNNVPGVPPLTKAGKVVFAWDQVQGTEPGDAQGNVLLNAHTFPDGSALGNQLLAKLQEGGRIVVRGAGQVLCYRVTERVEVPAAEGLARYYDTSGPPQLAIVVCSGRRLGPGEWEDRTIWFASPAA